MVRAFSPTARSSAISWWSISVSERLAQDEDAWHHREVSGDAEGAAAAEGAEQHEDYDRVRADDASGAARDDWRGPIRHSRAGFRGDTGAH